jgi:hypothetical protein
MYKVSRSKINGANGLRLLWSTGTISLNIQGRMKKTQNRCLFGKRIERGPGSSVVLMSGRKTLLLWPGRSHLATSLSANLRSGLVTPPRSHGGRNGAHVLTGLRSSLSIYNLVPLVRSTRKKEMIRRVEVGPGFGCGCSYLLHFLKFSVEIDLPEYFDLLLTFDNHVLKI